MELPEISTLLADSLMELVMFGLAALIYMLFKGPWATAELRTTANRVFKTPARARSDSRLAEAIDVRRQSAASPDAEILDMIAALPDHGVIQHEVAKQLLVALCRRSSALGEEVICRLTDLSGRFETRALEAAASEVSSKLPSVDACRKLYNVSGLASIPKTERALQLLARGHAQNRAALKCFVQDIIRKDSGVPLTRSLAECLSAVCSGAEEHELAQIILERVNNKGMAGFNVLSRQAKAISSYGRDGNLQAAVAVFQKTLADGFAPTVLVYNCLLDACVLCSDMTSALKYFTEMKAIGRTDAVSYNTLMKGHLGQNNLEAVRRLFAEMDASGSRGIPPNRYTYHSVLSALGQGGDRAAIWAIVNEMQEYGIRPDKVTCSILLKSVCSPLQVGDLRRIVELVDVCEKPTDDVLFSALLEACIRTGSHDLLWEQMEDFIKEGGTTKLSAPVYGSLIKAFGQVRDVDRMWTLWQEMETRQVSITAGTLACMIEALAHNGRCGEAWKLVQKLWEGAETRALITNLTYSTLMKGFATAKQPDHIQHLYQEMRERKLPINAVAYNTVLNALVRCDMINKVPEIMEHMMSADPPVEPDIITFSTIIKGYCNTGDLDKSLALVEVMKKSCGLCPDEVMYNSLLDGCAKQKRLEDALKLLDEMKEAKVAPSNYTLSIVTKLLGRSKRLDQAFALVERVCNEHKFRPNPPTYTCLMQACFNNRQLQRGLALHEKMLQTGDCSPDGKTYSVMLRGCLQANNHARAIEVVRCAYHLKGHSMTQTSGKPPGIAEDLLQEVLAKLGSSEAAKDLVEDLKSCLNVSMKTQPIAVWNSLSERRNRKQTNSRF